MDFPNPQQTDGPQRKLLRPSSLFVCLSVEYEMPPTGMEILEMPPSGIRISNLPPSGIEIFKMQPNGTLPAFREISPPAQPTPLQAGLLKPIKRVPMGILILAYVFTKPF